MEHRLHLRPLPADSLLVSDLSLVLYRGRQTEGNALWLHLLGLCIFPVFLLPFGNFTIFEIFQAGALLRFLSQPRWIPTSTI